MAPNTTFLFLGLATVIFFTQIQRPISYEILHESEPNFVDMLQKHPSLRA